MVKKEKKGELISEISQKFERAEVMIVTEYRGLTVEQISDLRKKLRDHKVEYTVVKNTLAGFAAKQTGKPDLSGLLKGPTAIAFGYGDPVQPAKVLLDYQKSSQGVMSVKGGLIGHQVLAAADVVSLSKLPSKKELLSKVVGSIQSPLSSLVFVLNGNLQGLSNVLQARVKQLEAKS